ncbi:hypothetical protein AB5N19_07977 [Seiridium cardinale]
MDDLPRAPGRPIPTCVRHGRRTCYQCLHSFNCDVNGNYDGDTQYGLREARRVAPCAGKDALFIPQLDAHLGLTAGISGGSAQLHGLEFEQEITMNSIEIIQPPAVAPSQDWFHYCKECQLTWMSGSEGSFAAAAHPSHLAIRDKRTLVCWAGVQDQASVNSSTSRAFHHFGPASKFNGWDEVASPTGAMTTATLKALRKARLRIAPERHSTIQDSATTNSETFVEKAGIFRLVVLVSDLDLVKVLTSLHTCLLWNEKHKAYRTINDETMEAVERLGSYELLHLLEEELDLLAECGITVKWYLVHPSLNKAISGVNEFSTTIDMKPINAQSAADSDDTVDRPARGGDSLICPPASLDRPSSPVENAQQLVEKQEANSRTNAPKKRKFNGIEADSIETGPPRDGPGLARSAEGRPRDGSPDIHTYAMNQ